MSIYCPWKKFSQHPSHNNHLASPPSHFISYPNTDGMATGDDTSSSANQAVNSSNISFSQPPQLRYFISRGNGTFVPLIPADELPFNIRLDGVQRVINIESASGMTLVGTQPFTGRFFHLADMSNANRRADASQSTHRRTASEHDTMSKSTSLPTRKLSPSTIATNWRSQNNFETQTQAKIDDIVAASPDASARSFKNISSTPSTPPSDDKVYCTYWIRHGECDFEQQGCRYKHEMPDKATLAKIGFGGGVPRWYQERMRVRLGKSKIPTVGEAVKPGHWLKRRGSQDSESSGYESESESEKEDRFVKKEVPAASALSDADKDGDGLDYDSKQSIRASEDEQDRITSTEVLQPEAETAAKTRQSSATSDLIDLGPATAYLSLGFDKTTVVSGDAYNPASATSPSPANREAEQAPAPRKVFVPAGEHPEFHITQSRKHVQKARVNKAHGQTSDHQVSTQKDLSAKDIPTQKHPANTTRGAEPLPTQTRQDLMASRWAQTVPSPSNGIYWGQVPPENTMRLMDFGKAPEYPGQNATSVPGSRFASNSQNSGTSSKIAVHVGEGKTPSKSAGGVRPRKPAGTGSKTEKSTGRKK